MALTDEQHKIWATLSSSDRYSFGDQIRHTPEDIAFEAPGVYAIWEGEKPVYIGVATLLRPHDIPARRLWGLKDRLDSHQKGRISGSSLAMSAWFCRVAPSLSPEQHQQIAKAELNPSDLTEDFVRKLTYSHYLVPREDLRSVESALVKEIGPDLNKWQNLIRQGTRARRKQLRIAGKAASSIDKPPFQ